MLEKNVGGLVDAHLEHVGDRLAAVLDLERLRIVALALTDLARYVDVRKEVHLDLDDTVALAGFATAAPDVESKSPRRVPAHSRFGN